MGKKVTATRYIRVILIRFILSEKGSDKVAMGGDIFVCQSFGLKFEIDWTFEHCYIAQNGEQLSIQCNMGLNHRQSCSSWILYFSSRNDKIHL